MIIQRKPHLEFLLTTITKNIRIVKVNKGNGGRIEQGNKKKTVIEF
jgi:hypothetical protein